MRQTSPAAERNKASLLQALHSLLPASGQMLEVAAGTGQHAVYLAAHLPGWQWWPSDTDATARASINDWAAEARLPNLQPALDLDVARQPWPLAGPLDAVFCANMLHIAPWACCAALMQGAAQVLAPAGQLITYGPYLVQGEPTAASNWAFDADLRQRNPAWGLRWLHDIEAQAHAAGLRLAQRLPMPANNQVLVFQRG